MNQTDYKINFSGEQAWSFYCALLDAMVAVESLQAATTIFPAPAGIAIGEADPRITIEAFTSLAMQRLGILLGMVDGENKGGE
jgi:hypothetical protein